MFREMYITALNKKLRLLYHDVCYNLRQIRAQIFVKFYHLSAFKLLCKEWISLYHVHRYVRVATPTSPTFLNLKLILHNTDRITLSAEPVPLYPLPLHISVTTPRTRHVTTNPHYQHYPIVNDALLLTIVEFIDTPLLNSISAGHSRHAGHLGFAT